MFCQYWNENGGNQIKWINQAEENAPHEANFLKLDCSKVKRTFGWKPHWSVEEAVAKTVEWSKAYDCEQDVVPCMERQIKDFFEK